jgi:hypothetical protein
MNYLNACLHEGALEGEISGSDENTKMQSTAIRQTFSKLRINNGAIKIPGFGGGRLSGAKRMLPSKKEVM